MADDATPTPPESSNDSGSSFVPPASQEEFNQIIEGRLARERQKYADYDDMKKRLSEIEDANKTELQKLAEERDSLKNTHVDLQSENARLKAAVKFGLSDEDVAALDGVPADKVEALAERLAQKTPKKTPPKPSGLQSGASNGAPQAAGKERAAAALRQLRTGR